MYTSPTPSRPDILYAVNVVRLLKLRFLAHRPHFVGITSLPVRRQSREENDKNALLPRTNSILPETADRIFEISL